jgi:hypothetical protein
MRLLVWGTRFWVLVFMMLSMSITAQETGRVLFDVNLDKLFLVIDGDLENAHAYSQNLIIELPSGEREITIIHPEVNNFTYTLNVHADSLIVSQFNLISFRRNPKSSYQILKQNSNLNISTEPAGAIYIDDELYGTGTLNALLNPGKYSIRIVHPEFGTLRKTVHTDALKPAQLQLFNQNHKPIPVPFRLLPGGAYFNNKQFKRLGLAYAGFVPLSALLIHRYQKVSALNSEFDDLERFYLQADQLSDVKNYRSQLNDTQARIKSNNKQINQFWLITAAWYTLTTLDGLRKPRSGYKTPGNEFNLETTTLFEQPTMHFTLTRNF